MRLCLVAVTLCGLVLPTLSLTPAETCNLCKVVLRSVYGHFSANVSNRRKLANQMKHECNRHYNYRRRCILWTKENAQILYTEMNTPNFKPDNICLLLKVNNNKIEDNNNNLNNDNNEINNNNNNQINNDDNNIDNNIIINVSNKHIIINNNNDDDDNFQECKAVEAVKTINNTSFQDIRIPATVILSNSSSSDISTSTTTTTTGSTVVEALQENID